MPAEEITENLDVRGIPCPKNYARILLRMEVMAPGELLEVLLDAGEPFANVSNAVLDEGHQIVSQEQSGPHWRMIVRRL